MNVGLSSALGAASQQVQPQPDVTGDDTAAALGQAQASSADTLDSGQYTPNSLMDAVARADLEAAQAPGEDDAYRITVLNPGLSANAQGHAHYAQVDGQLFGKQPSSAMFQDPDQGRMNDCYFVQAMSAVAYKHPGFMKHAVHKNDDGTVTVRLFTKDASTNTMKPVQVTVGPELPVSNATGNLFYTHSTTPNELWPSYVEKAYAALEQFQKQQPGYNAIGNKGTPGEAFAALTGVSSQQLFKFSTDQPTPAQVYQGIKQALDNGQYVTAGTPENPVAGLVSDHAYSVLGVSTEGGHAYVTLRNPWGHGELGDDGTDDGIFKITMKQLISDYAGVVVSG